MLYSLATRKSHQGFLPGGATAISASLTSQVFTLCHNITSQFIYCVRYKSGKGFACCFPQPFQLNDLVSV